MTIEKIGHSTVGLAEDSGREMPSAIFAMEPRFIRLGLLSVDCLFGVSDEEYDLSCVSQRLEANGLASIS